MQLVSESRAHKPDLPAVEVSVVTPDVLDYVWQKILPQVRKGLSKGQGDGTTPEAMLYAIAKGEMQLWVAHRGDDILAGVVISVNRHVTGTKLFVQLAAGREMGSWLPQIIAALKRYKNDIGAMCIEASCRPGMAKALREQGWSRKAIVMECE